MLSASIFELQILLLVEPYRVNGVDSNCNQSIIFIYLFVTVHLTKYMYNKATIVSTHGNGLPEKPINSSSSWPPIW